MRKKVLDIEKLENIQKIYSLQKPIVCMTVNEQFEVIQVSQINFFLFNSATIRRAHKHLADHTTIMY